MYGACVYYSRLQEQLASGKTVVTGEIAPPRGASPATLLRVASNLAPAVDALLGLPRRVKDL